MVLPQDPSTDRCGARLPADEMEHEGFQSLREMGLNVAENSTFLPEESEPVSIDDLKELFTARPEQNPRPALCGAHS